MKIENHKVAVILYNRNIKMNIEPAKLFKTSMLCSIIAIPVFGISSFFTPLELTIPYLIHPVLYLIFTLLKDEERKSIAAHEVGSIFVYAGFSIWFLASIFMALFFVMSVVTLGIFDPFALLYLSGGLCYIVANIAGGLFFHSLKKTASTGSSDAHAPLIDSNAV